MAVSQVFLYLDIKYLPQMSGETSRRYLFVAIDRAMRRGYAMHPWRYDGTSQRLISCAG